MSPKHILLLFSLFIFGQFVSAQYTEKINTNRPGTSQGAFSVGNNVLQLEGGFGFGKEKHKILSTKSNVFNLDYSIRYGLLIEQLEIRLNGKFRADGVTQTIGGDEQKIKRSNFETNTIGAKYLIYDPYKKPKDKDSLDYSSLKSWKEHHRFKWKSLIPAVSAYLGANFVSKNNPFTAPDDEGFSPKIVVMTQNNWTTSINGNWVLVTNLIVDKITTKDPIIGWIITSTHTINDKWAAFGEYQGQKSDFYSDDIMRFGGAYLYDQDLQFDANIAFNFKDTPSIFTLSFGASYRFDWHNKDEIIEKPGLESGVKEGEEEEEDEELEEDEENFDEFDEKDEIENDSLKLGKTPFVNDFEEDNFRDAIEKDLDERRTEQRLERERIENEKIAKKEGKKFKKEESRRLKREAKEARKAEKDKIRAEKEKQKMIDDIDAELDKMEKEKGVDQELQDIDQELKELEKMEKEFENEEKKTDEKAKEKEEEEKQKEQEDEDIDAEFEKYEKEQAKIKKAEEKRRKKEEKKRLKEEKKKKKEKKNKKDDESELDKALEELE
ncbi:transporter [Aquimarina sp. 2201CG1-2-11]|uniref:transporter n=1 Tax=Aquimarina discodermiae TaxID=3231043 RepID=UPI003463507D